MSKVLKGLVVAVVAVGVGVGIAVHNAETASVTSSQEVYGPNEALGQVRSKVSNEVSTVTKLSNFKVKSKESVFLNSEIYDNGDSIAQQLISVSEKQDKVYLFIPSPGGSILEGSKIVGAIQALKSKTTVTTVCIELCASMAAIIFEYGTERLMSSSGVLMFHNASGGFRGEFPRMASLAHMLGAFIGEFELNTAKRAGISLDAYREAANQELWLTANQAVSSGFADKVVLYPTIVGKDSEKKEPALKTKRAPTRTNSARRTEFSLDWIL